MNRLLDTMPPSVALSCTCPWVLEYTIYVACACATLVGCQTTPSLPQTKQVTQIIDPWKPTHWAENSGDIPNYFQLKYFPDGTKMNRDYFTDERWQSNTELAAAMAPLHIAEVVAWTTDAQKGVIQVILRFDTDDHRDGADKEKILQFCRETAAEHAPFVSQPRKWDGFLERVQYDGFAVDLEYASYVQEQEIAGE